MQEFSLSSFFQSDDFCLGRPYVLAIDKHKKKGQREGLSEERRDVKVVLFGFFTSVETKKGLFHLVSCGPKILKAKPFEKNQRLNTKKDRRNLLLQDITNKGLRALNF